MEIISPTACVLSLSATMFSATSSTCWRMSAMVRLVSSTAVKPDMLATEAASAAVATCLARSAICAPDWRTSSIVAVISWIVDACCLVPAACC